MKTENVLFMCWTVILLPVFHGQVGEHHYSILFSLLTNAGLKSYLFWAPAYAFFVWAVGCAIIHGAVTLVKSLH